MIRPVGLLLALALPASVAGLTVADSTLSLGLSLAEMFLAVTLIVGFAVVATAWSLRRDV